MGGVIAEVGTRDQPPADLPLNREIPRVDLRRAEVRVRHGVHTAGREEAVGFRRARILLVRIAAGAAGPRVRQRKRSAAAGQRRAPRRIVGDTRIEEWMRRVGEQPVGRAGRSLAVTARYPYPRY